MAAEAGGSELPEGVGQSVRGLPPGTPRRFSVARRRGGSRHIRVVAREFAGPLPNLRLCGADQDELRRGARPGRRARRGSGDQARRRPVRAQQGGTVRPGHRDPALRGFGISRIPASNGHSAAWFEVILMRDGEPQPHCSRAVSALGRRLPHARRQRPVYPVYRVAAPRADRRLPARPRRNAPASVTSASWPTPRRRTAVPGVRRPGCGKRMSAQTSMRQTRHIRLHRNRRRQVLWPECRCPLRAQSCGSCPTSGRRSGGLELPSRANIGHR
jgi:hypothetical protein